MDDIQNSVIKSQAQLDQAWATVEPLFMHISNIAEKGFGIHTTIDDLSIARLCTQLVSWELGVRLLQRDFQLKAIAYTDDGNADEAMVRIVTPNGHVKFYIPSNFVELEESDITQVPCKIKVIAYKILGGMYMVILPTTSKDAVIVLESEIILE